MELRRSCFILLTAATSLPMRRAIIHVGVQTALRFSAAHPICCQRSPHFAVASSASHKLEQSSFMFCQVQNFPYLLIISNTNYEDTKTLSSALPSQSLKLSEHHPACTEWLPFLQQAAFLSNWFIPTTDHTTNFATKNRLLFMSHINLCKVAAGSTSHITWPLQLAIDHPETPAGWLHRHPPHRGILCNKAMQGNTSNYLRLSKTFFKPFTSHVSSYLEYMCFEVV